MKMKVMKRFSSILLALVMMLAMVMTVSAGNVTTQENNSIEDTTDPDGETTTPGGDTTAPEKKTLSISNPVEGHTYTAYQILQGELAADGKLTKLDWGAGITDKGKAALKAHLGLDDGATVAQVAVEIGKLANDSEEMDAVAQILGDNVAGNGTPLTTSDASVSATVDQGYYVILDTMGEGAASNSTVSKYMVQVVGDVSITTKAGTTTSQKTVKDGENAKAEFTQTNIGKEETFYLVAKLPADYTAYKAFYMNFKDTMQHMDFVGVTSVKVKKDVSGSTVGEIDPSTGTDVETIAEANYTLTVPETAEKDGSLTWNLEILDLKKVCEAAKAGDCVVIEYKAKLNKGAVINGANKNEFELEFSKDPNSEVIPTPDGPKPPIGTTPKDEADLYTTELELLKKDGTTGDILTGAEFTLTGDTNDVVIKTATVFEEKSDGEYWKLKNDTYTKDAPTDATKDLYKDTTTKYAPTIVTEIVKGTTDKTAITAEVGSDGRVIFSGLGAGSYTLTETKTPAGYNTMEPINFTITFNKEDKTFSASKGFSLKVDIPNFSGTELPSTGGIGTTIFYVVGGILVVGAVVLLVVKKRMSHQA
ncbi:MAG: isopeptide-forming domain-containing fimbrial protein [Lachnospiraceae bacterium]|nr:isopeptide-forming domain-containing fimbrial protein [Lachnospiraceae bacterium]